MPRKTNSVNLINFTVVKKRRYTFFHFLFDCFMTIATCGLWFIWIIIRSITN